MKVDFFHIVANLIVLTYLVHCQSSAKTFVGSPYQVFWALYIIYVVYMDQPMNKMYSKLMFSGEQNHLPLRFVCKCIVISVFWQFNGDFVYFGISNVHVR